MRDTPRALRLFSIMTLWCALGAAACVSGRVDEAHRSAAASEQFAQARILVAAKNWPEALTVMHSIVDAKTFATLPGDFRYRALRVASRVSLYHGPPKWGRDYLIRLTAMPQADYRDWLDRLRAADILGSDADAVNDLTVLVQRWPNHCEEIGPENVLRIANETRHVPGDAALRLLQALYDAHWKLQWDIEPSPTWRDLSLLLLEKDRFSQAKEVAGRVTDVYVLIAMRGDRRFDAIVAANPRQFDIQSAADREVQTFQSAAENAPGSLELKSDAIEALFHESRYEAALAAADAVLADIRSTNYPEKLFADYSDQIALFLDLRSIALEGVGRWDEALAQLTEASLLHEKYSGNVDELINLGDLYCSLGRPKEALSAIGRIVARTSPYGAAQLERVRLDAAVQLGDAKQVARSLDYLGTHRGETPSAYVDALIIGDQPDRAAHELARQLLDKDQRQGALLRVQGLEPSPGTARDADFEARRHAVIRTREVQAAIQKVGRIESHSLEEPLEED